MPTRLLHTAAALLILACLGAWGRDGHAIIAEIARLEMTPAARERAAQILAGQEIPAVAAWADQVRRTEAYRFTAPMHYVNLPPGTAAYDHAAHCPDEGCVVSAIDDFARLLIDGADDKTREDALKFIIHFVGDLHQPLHAGRPDDRGGNDIDTVFFGRDRNLHSVWDSGILNAGDPQPWPLIAERLAAEIDDADRLAWLAEAKADDLIATAVAWTFESHRLAERYAYPITTGSAIGQPYVDAALPIVHLRLKQGGVRLGALLNQLLDPASQGLSPALDPAKVIDPPASTGDGADPAPYSQGPGPRVRMSVGLGSGERIGWRPGSDEPIPSKFGWSAARRRRPIRDQESCMPKQDDKFTMEAIVIEALPNAMFKLRLPNEQQSEVLGYVSGKMRKNYIRILPGDTVTVEISPYDLTKARITYRR